LFDSLSLTVKILYNLQRFQYMIFNRLLNDNKII
jgi:hypothetical protein